MIHILLLILKIIGILLLVVVGICLLLIAVILFAPIRYCIEGDFPGDIKEVTGVAKFTYLLGIFRVWVEWKENQLEIRPFILWKKIGEKKEEKPSNSEKRKAKKKKTVQTQKKEQSKKDKDVYVPSESQKDVQLKRSAPESEKKPNSKIDIKEDLHEQSQGKKEGKIASLLNRIKCTITGLCDKLKKLQDKKDYVEQFLSDEVHVRSFHKAKRILGKVLKKILPKKVVGNLKFGFDNPYYTGKVLSYLAMAYPFLPREFTIVPDFENEVLEGEINMKGKILIYPFVIAGLKIWFDKEIKQSIQDIREFKL